MTGARQERDNSEWWEVLYPRVRSGIGWVNARFLVPAKPNAAPETGYPLLCAGTEPFWSLHIAAGRAKYSSPDAHDMSFTTSAWLPAHGSRGLFAIRLGKRERTAKSGYAVVARNPACSDGMSDTLYPFNNVLIMPDGQVLDGCCRRVAE